MKKTFRALVTGRVQGVWFRQSTADKANELGLTGWVRNLSSGQVEALVEGEEEKVDALVNWLKEGPPMAEVENLELSESSPENLLPPFTVERSV